jgi:hypothetical protein
MLALGSLKFIVQLLVVICELELGSLGIPEAYPVTVQFGAVLQKDAAKFIVYVPVLPLVTDDTPFTPLVENCLCKVHGDELQSEGSEPPLNAKEISFPLKLPAAAHLIPFVCVESAVNTNPSVPTAWRTEFVPSWVTISPFVVSGSRALNAAVCDV